MTFQKYFFSFSHIDVIIYCHWYSFSFVKVDQLKIWLLKIIVNELSQGNYFLVKWLSLPTKS